MPDHPGLAEREGDEHSDRVKRDQGGDAASERDDQDGREERKDDDARSEREAVTAELEVVGGETVAGQDASEAREIGEGRVGREDEQQRCRDLHEVVVRSAVPDEGPRELTHHRLLLRRIGNDPKLAREKAHPEEDRAEERAHEDEDDLRVARLGALGCGDAVRDRLHTSERD